MAAFTIFSALTAAGAFGCSQMKQDFKLEWFIPSDSYVNNFFTLNEEYFSTGTKVDVHTKGIDYYASRAQLDGLHTYLKGSKYVDQDEGIGDWYEEFKGATGTFDDARAAKARAGIAVLSGAHRAEHLALLAEHVLEDISGLPLLLRGHFQ